MSSGPKTTVEYHVPEATFLAYCWVSSLYCFPQLLIVSLGSRITHIHMYMAQNLSATAVFGECACLCAQAAAANKIVYNT